MTFSLYKRQWNKTLSSMEEEYHRIRPAFISILL